jgi:hypothetical protein
MKKVTVSDWDPAEITFLENLGYRQKFEPMLSGGGGGGGSRNLEGVERVGPSGAVKKQKKSVVIHKV